MITILGIDTRLTVAGHHQPWRLVVYNKTQPQSRRQYVGAVPDVPYIRVPRDPVYGDLRRLGISLSDRMKEAIDLMLREGVTTAHVAAHRCAIPEICALTDAGLKIVEHDMPVPEEACLLDPLAIGGHAGHEIAVIAKNLEINR